MRPETKAQIYLVEREAGATYAEIARKYGVSRQAVYQCCAKRNVSRFKVYKEEEVIYPNLRRWLNENKVSRTELLRRMEVTPFPASSARVSNWFRGKTVPCKASIDKLLAITGLTYEQLFYKDNQEAHE